MMYVVVINKHSIKLCFTGRSANHCQPVAAHSLLLASGKTPSHTHKPKHSRILQ